MLLEAHSAICDSQHAQAATLLDVLGLPDSRLIARSPVYGHLRWSNGFPLWKERLFRAGQDPSVDSLEMLGNVLEEFMDLVPDDSEESLEAAGSAYLKQTEEKQ